MGGWVQKCFCSGAVVRGRVVLAVLVRWKAKVVDRRPGRRSQNKQHRHAVSRRLWGGRVAGGAASRHARHARTVARTRASARICSHRTPFSAKQTRTSFVLISIKPSSSSLFALSALSAMPLDQCPLSAAPYPFQLIQARQPRPPNHHCLVWHVVRTVVRERAA